ncbi:MAG: hypothetical protein C4575_14040 [Desulforudis sp.]|jgi:hypothetical protein|nr:MAG: hypothetical protein C4575_14040 [Desulforudis sp.]
MTDSNNQNLTLYIDNLRTAQDIHYLYPEVIYRFNARLHLNWLASRLGSDDGSNNENVFLVTTFFSKHSRTFNWISVNRSMWHWRQSGENNETLTLLKKLDAEFKKWCCANTYNISKFGDLSLSKRINAVKTVLRDLPQGAFYEDAKCYAEEILSGKTSSSDDNEKLHRRLLALYSGFHHSADKNLEGLFYYFLKKCGKFCINRRLDMLAGELFNPGEKESQPPLRWIRIENEQDAIPAYNNTHCALNMYVPLSQPDAHTSCEPEKDDSSLPDDSQLLAEQVFLRYLLLDPKDSTGLSLGKRIGKCRKVVLLPLYDVWIDDWGVGGIMAVMAVFFSDAPTRKKWLKTKYPLFLRSFPELSAEITASAKTLATTAEIKPQNDLVRHFLDVLVFMQDWETAVVFDNTMPIYGYRRIKKESSSEKWEWEYEGPCSSAFDMIPNNPERLIQQSGGKHFMWWSAGEGGTINCWSKNFIPDILEQEISTFGRLSIRFEFPEASYIPPEDNIRILLCEEYLRQQLDLMRMLIPKIRTRRAALQTAVSAIMGRNLSHNIGSHVLARYSNAAGRVREQRAYNAGASIEDSAVEDGVEDHRSVFLRYLQRRMDFIAEVSTSGKSLFSQPLSLSTVLSALNLDLERGRVNKQKGSMEGKKFEPILLSYISGKEGIVASVDISGIMHSDALFSCPGGEVGAHALYVILENIIRNSARHNTDDFGNIVSVKVEIDDSEGYPDLWKFTIIDCQSINKVKENVERINIIINDDPILNRDGSPNQKFWGIREVQICAHYLRNFSMGDLGKALDGPAVLNACEFYDVEKETSFLAYEIYLHRAKLCALVCDRVTLDSLIGQENIENVNKMLRNKGMQIYSSFPGEALLKGYSFVVVDSSMAQKHNSETGEVAALLIDGQGSVPMLTLPVRTKLLDAGFLISCFGGLLSSDFNPEACLEQLHEIIWREYVNKRDEWNGKEVIAFIGWDKEKNVHWDNGQQYLVNGRYWHCNKGDWAQFVADKVYQNLIILCGHHANSKDFAKTGSPNLLSAGYYTGDNSYRENIVFSEMLESLSPHEPFLEKQFSTEAAGGELLAAALARVIVLDERVQNELCRKYRKVEYKTLWPCMGIWVPDSTDEPEECRNIPFSSSGDCPKTNLNRPDFDSIQNFLRNPARLGGHCPPDFLILHLTILENLTKGPKGKEDEAQTLSALLEGTKVGAECEIVIVTGRGVSSFNRHNGMRVRYLPISALLEYLLARPSKLALMRALWSASTAI